MSQRSFWVKGTLLLTLAGFLSKILGMIYRVPLQNIAGDEGLYVYQQVYPILSVALILSLYSFPGAISQIVASDQKKSDVAEIKNPSKLFILFFAFGLIVFLSLYFSADQIAILMGDEQLTESIRLASVMFLLIPFTALFRGVFQGLEKTTYVASSQIIEQFIRVIFIILFTIIVTTHNLSVYDIGRLASLGTVIGSIVAILFLTITYSRLKKKGLFKVINNLTVNKKMLQVLTVVAVVYSLNYLLHLMIQIVDVFTMVNTLQTFGFSFEEARISKGVYDRGNAIIQLGLVFGSSLALALIPSIQKNVYADKEERLAFKSSFALSLAATAGLIAIMPLFNPLLYKDDNGTTAIQMMMLLVFLLSMVILFSVFLQRYNYRFMQLLWISLMLVIKIILNLLLIPHYGIIGASIASVIAVSILLTIFFIKWVQLSKQAIQVAFIFKVIFSTLVMGTSVGTVSIWLGDFQIERITLFLIVIALCIVGALIFLSLITILKVFSKSEKEQLLNRQTEEGL